MASIVSRENVENALERLIIEKRTLRSATKYNLIYKGKAFPPKEIVRYAAIDMGITENDFKNYRLQGGPPTNSYLEKLGFKIVQFSDWKHATNDNNEKRVARICWNDKGWVIPSGIIGKSKYEESHEARYGYGHEEWLFDIGRVIDGYHYGFLEPVRKQQDAYTGKTFTIWLYTIDNRTKNRYWVGEIFGAEVISITEADRIKKEYIRKGWLSVMEEQIRNSGANPKGFSNYKGVDLFNIRFKPNDYRLNNPYFELPQNHPINQQSRYSFGRFDDEYILDYKPNQKFCFLPDSRIKNRAFDMSNSSYNREEKTVQVLYLHNEIIKKFSKQLIEKHGNSNVRLEHPTGYGDNRIDIVVNTKAGLIFYEIKTYPSIRTSIRQALGQIIEYATWPDQNRAKELIIVTQPTQEVDEVKAYMIHLRKQFNIPVFYQSFDTEKCIVSDKY